MSEPRNAATVILVREREGTGELEVLLLCRHRGAGFMANAFVFPGGVEEPEDAGDLRVTAARELFEEGGVLLCDGDVSEELRTTLRKRVAAGEPAGAVLAEADLKFEPETLHYVSRWLTPSAERRRYLATFYIAQMPAGQTAEFDDVETVDQVWVTVDEALSRSGELRLPPPQVRTFMDLAAALGSGWSSLVAEAGTREQAPAVILPRFASLEGNGNGATFALLLPWDPDYERLGTGDAQPLPDNHPLATGPSRFVFEEETWKNINAPSSPTADSSSTAH